MLKLRIFRSWTWELACSPMEVRYGGENPMKLVAHDELQFYGQDDDGKIGWNPVKIVEAEKPKHPRVAKREAEFERQAKKIEDLFANAKQAHFAIGIQRHGEPSKCICGGMILDKKCENDTGDRAI